MPEAVRHQVVDWLEWEERVLRPAAQSPQPAHLAAALAQLDQACTSGQMFLGHSLTLADVAIFSALQSADGSTEASQTSVRRPGLSGCLAQQEVHALMRQIKPNLFAVIGITLHARVMIIHSIESSDVFSCALAAPAKREAVHREAGGSARNQGGAFPAETGE